MTHKMHFNIKMCMQINEAGPIVRLGAFNLTFSTLWYFLRDMMFVIVLKPETRRIAYV